MLLAIHCCGANHKCKNLSVFFGTDENNIQGQFIVMASAIFFIISRFLHSV
jgi:hypothetical protein